MSRAVSAFRGFLRLSRRGKAPLSTYPLRSRPALGFRPALCVFPRERKNRKSFASFSSRLPSRNGTDRASTLAFRRWERADRFFAERRRPLRADHFVAREKTKTERVTNRSSGEFSGVIGLQGKARISGCHPPRRQISRGESCVIDII